MTQTTKRVRDRGERGIALVAVLFVMVLLLGIGAALHTGVMSETSVRGAHLRATLGFYAAEAGINRGMGDYRDIFLSYNVPTGSDFNPHTLSIDQRQVTYQLVNDPGNPYTQPVPTGRPFAGLNATEYRYSDNSTSQLVSGDTEASIGTKFNVDYIPIFQFLAFYQGDLEMLPGPPSTFHGPIHTNGNAYLNSNNTMTIADCLQGGAPGQCPAPIPIVHLSASKEIYRGRKDANTCIGHVWVSKLVDADHNGALDQQEVMCSGGSTTQLSPATLSTWLGAMSNHQPTVAVPSPGVLVRGSGEYWQKADLRIVLDLDSPVAGHFPIVVQAVDGSTDPKNAVLQNFMQAPGKAGRVFYNDVPSAGNRGTTSAATCASAAPGSGNYCHKDSYPAGLTQPAVYACPGSDLNLYPGCAAYIQNEALGGGLVTARRGGFYNNREHDWVYMLNLNLHDLLAWNRAQPPGNQFFDPNNNNEGGIVIYLTVKGPGSNLACTPSTSCSSPRYGVRVFATPNLDFPAGMSDPTGVTVISDQAIYVEGDYNSGTGACTFGGSGACPWMPAAFMGDTLNVLSDNWSSSAACRNDCQSYQPLNSRPGTGATIFAAFIAGVDTTLPGVYNGGFENYPRFHEDWSGTLFYRGSFVSLWTPQHSNGIWCGTSGSCTVGSGGCGTTGACNIYNPPTRNWDYDTNFQNVANLPPITPRFVTVQQILFTENFR